ncbi:MAG: hypothetical protein II886_06890, partial [Prevotella sp.]|nr:hypothetical protein [Prevotella sp.]
HIQYQQRAAAKQLRTLYLTQTVAVDCRGTSSTTRTYGTPACSMRSQHHKGFITRHAIKRYVPGMAFFTHT